jgi:hypothetical protein
MSDFREGIISFKNVKKNEQYSRWQIAVFPLPVSSIPVHSGQVGHFSRGEL